MYTQCEIRRYLSSTAYEWYSVWINKSDAVTGNKLKIWDKKVWTIHSTYGLAKKQDIVVSPWGRIPYTIVK